MLEVLALMPDDVGNVVDNKPHFRNVFDDKEIRGRDLRVDRDDKACGHMEVDHNLERKEVVVYP